MTLPAKEVRRIREAIAQMLDARRGTPSMVSALDALVCELRCDRGPDCPDCAGGEWDVAIRGPRKTGKAV